MIIHLISRPGICISIKGSQIGLMSGAILKGYSIRSSDHTPKLLTV
jgi:hypothetical protein